MRCGILFQRFGVRRDSIAGGRPNELLPPFLIVRLAGEKKGAVPPKYSLEWVCLSSDSQILFRKGRGDGNAGIEHAI